MIEHIPSDLDISRVTNIGFYKFLKKIGFRELIKRWSVLSISCFHKNIQVKWPEDHKDAPLLKIGCVYLVFILRNDRKTKKYKTCHRETQETFSFYNLSLFSHCISVSFQQKWQNSYEYQKICKSAYFEKTLRGVLITFYINTSVSTSCRKIGSLKKSWCQSVFYDDFH